MELATTPSQTVGPFFHFCLTSDECCVRSIAGPQVRGERVLLTVRVLDGNNEPVPDAMIEIWQANSEGKYNHPDDTQQKAVETGFLGFGRMGTVENGGCEFETIKPGRVPGVGNCASSAASEHCGIRTRHDETTLYADIFRRRSREPGRRCTFSGAAGAARRL